MISKVEADKEVVRQVVRGQRPWTDLRTIGIEWEIFVAVNPFGRDREHAALRHRIAGVDGEIDDDLR